MVFERDESVILRLSLFLDGETSLNAERFWAGRLRQARVDEQERQA
jgi:hypothetical protein